METKHTKGEWKSRPHKIANFNIFTDEKCKEGIADCWSIETSNEETEANAKLIAAAPELLESCIRANELFRYALNKFDWGNSALDAKAIDQLNTIPNIVRKAIKKATE